MGLLGADASAQSSGVAVRYRFEIAAQSLSRALRTVADISGQDIIFTEDLVAGLSAAPLEGILTAEEAMRRLLQGAALTTRRSASGALMIVREPGATRQPPARDAAVPQERNDKAITIEDRARAIAEPKIGATLPTLDEITVTGSRVIRDGFESPTPVTVIGAEHLRADAAIQIADSLNRLPIVAGSVSQANIGVNTSNGEAGSNTLNLRGMGAGRTLVLFDGRRVVSVGLRGTTDIGHIPTTLLERVDIVTGGASAPYGSDAMTGIANFVLDRDFVGLRANLMGGVTDYGDNEQYKAEFGYGSLFADNRGHLMFGAEHTDVAGVNSIGGRRPWATNTKAVGNAAYTPSNGQPFLLARPNAEFSTMAPGMLITSGPLAGTEFFGRGETRPFRYGANVTSGLLMEGGANTDTERTQLVQSQKRSNVFARASYQVNDFVSVWSDLLYSQTSGINDCCTHFFPGNVTIQDDNAFLPAPIAAQMATLGITSFQAGTSNEDQQTLHGHNRRDMRQFAIGARGLLLWTDHSGNPWGWDAYLQRGVSRTNLRVHQMNRVKWNQAIDAVRDPLTGAIVCRSTLSDAGNGCVPLNRFGTGTVSREARDYVIGFTPYEEQVTQDVAEINITGEPFATWAKPVSVAFGAQYRREQVRSYAEAESIDNHWFAANFKPTFGSYDVFDGFLETVLPLASEVRWAKALDLNAAMRVTHYSTSGLVKTWKVGATYQPTSEFRFRATQSRDIHSPGFGDLYRAGQVNSVTARDPFNGNLERTFDRPLVGNPNLKPEEADTTGFGIVYQPAWLPRFSLSADYFHIKVLGAFAIPDVQLVINRCFQGDQSYCAAIERDAQGMLSFVTVMPLNADRQTSEGIDFELSYRLQAADLFASWRGDVSLRLLATHTMMNKLIVNDVAIDLAGKNSDDEAYPGIPKWRWLASVNYSNAPWLVDMTLRGISHGVINPAWIECTAACPTSTAAHRTIDDNSVAGATWMDLSLSYRLPQGTEAYFRVDNVFDRGAPPVADDYFLSQGFNAGLYDTLGRTYRLGLRFGF